MSKLSHTMAWGAALVVSLFMVGMGPAHAEDGASAYPDPAAAWDALWDEIVIDISVIGLIFGVAAIYMLLKGWSKDPEKMGRSPKLSRPQAIAWALIPAALFMADDFYLSAKGWTLWNVQRDVPEGAMEIKVNGSQWSWEFDYGNGVYTYSRVREWDDEAETAADFLPLDLSGEDDAVGLVVPKGQPIVLRMTSTDVVHSFFLPRYRVKEDLMPGRITYVWFNPIEETKSEGDFANVATCVEYCGTIHTRMYTTVTVLEQEEYDAWMNGALQNAGLPNPPSNATAQAPTQPQVGSEG